MDLTPCCTSLIADHLIAGGGEGYVFLWKKDCSAIMENSLFSYLLEKNVCS